MTNDECRAEGCMFCESREALKAVLELHKPDPCDECVTRGKHFFCPADEETYPCETVRAIARALDVEIGEINDEQR